MNPIHECVSETDSFWALLALLLFQLAYCIQYMRQDFWIGQNQGLSYKLGGNVGQLVLSETESMP